METALSRSKRPKIYHHGEVLLRDERLDGKDLDEDILTNQSLFALDVPESPPTVSEPYASSSGDSSRKRNRDEISEDEVLAQILANPPWENGDLSFPDQEWLMSMLSPQAPSLEDRMVNLSISNPYAESSEIRHPTLRKSASIPEGGAVNGYIKFRLQMSDVDENSEKKKRRGVLEQKQGATQEVLSQPGIAAIKQSVPYLPANFGKGLRLDPTDNKLLKFYVVAYCQGRTLLSKTNFWVNDIAPMAVADECVMHAVLALAGSYILDYLPSVKLLQRTNQHYQKAAKLITEALAQPETHEVGKGDNVISAVLLLLVDDCVNWELRKSNGLAPNWYLGGRLAKSLLDQSDPGYRYWKTVNVQWSSSRYANANWGAFACILAQPVTPLKLEEENGPMFGWLLQGTAKEARKIHGSSGMSPKLLHMYAQITHLSARMKQTPNSDIIPFGAKKIEQQLENLHQWSDLSEGYLDAKTLLSSCVLDANGKVTTAAKVTELTGETWLATAQIYLHCRYYRKPRSHPKVQEKLDVLLRCVERMPYNGPLFTSQAPFFPIFIMGLIAYREEDREVARMWFDTVVSGASCRSSVPPVWKAVQKMWQWMDLELVDESYEDEMPIGQRRAWWEDMVEKLIETAGWISLT